VRRLDLTCETPEENLALDEALLEQAEQSGRPAEVLRIWEPAQQFVVVGRSSRIDAEVNRDICRQRGIPILRRASGGTAIVTGPGCLMYAVVLSHELRPHLRAIDETHRFVLTRLAEAFGRRLPGIAHQGTSDLTLEDRKFSGNSMRAKREHLLYHGTLLYDFPLELIGQCLPAPPRQPDYRQARHHDQFVGNLPLTASDLRAALIEAFDAHEPLLDWPAASTRQLAAEKYSRPEWIYQR
jgi:lipoate-protein ligase A